MHGQGPSHTIERQTHGSEQRPPRNLAVALREFDASVIAERLASEPAFLSDGRNAETVHGDEHVRIVVSVVAAGREIGAEHSDGYVTLTIHEGEGSLARGEERVSSLAAGSTVIVAPGSPWSFEARVATVLLAYFWEFGRPGSASAARAGVLEGVR